MSTLTVSNSAFDTLHELLDGFVSAPSRHDDLDLTLAAVYAVKLGLLDGRSPLWLFFVDPPSSGKTEIVGALRPDKDHVVFLDTLTPEAFLSGAVSKQGARAAKLLPQLNGKCLIVKDLTTLFSLKHESVKKILGDLQSIYDGEFRKGYGTGFDGNAILEAASYFGFIGCVTPGALATHQKYLANIGTRFLVYQRPPLTAADRARGYELQQQGRRAEMRAALQAGARDHLVALFREGPRATIPPECDDVLKTCAEYVRLGRTPIYTEDGQRLRGVPEEPFRIYQQLRLAVEALAAVRGHTVVKPEDTQVVERIALASIFHRRYAAIRALLQSPTQTLTVAEAGPLMDLEVTQTRLWLDDMVKVGLFERDPGGRYRAVEGFRTLIHGSQARPRSISPIRKQILEAEERNRLESASTSIGMGEMDRGADFSPGRANLKRERGEKRVRAGEQPGHSLVAKGVLNAYLRRCFSVASLATSSLSLWRDWWGGEKRRQRHRDVSER
jgi:hypothetical protein